MDEIQEIEAVLRALGEGETAQGAGIARVAVEDYLSAERFAAEARLLRRSPVVAGHASQLQQAGSFFTTEVAGRPLLLTRPAGGAARAFLNACRHRGTKLVCEAEGQGAQAFVCPYHAWTYRCDGRLLGIAHEKSFGEVRREELGLVPVPLVERFGLLWVVPEKESEKESGREGEREGEGQREGERAGAPSLPAGLEAELEWLGLATHVRFRPSLRRWRFNWKLGIDGGLETYHFRFAHEKTIASFFFDNLLLYADYAPHVRMTLAKRTIRSLPDTPRAGWRLRDHANLLYFLFPNTFLLVQADYVALIRMLPVSPSESDIEITMLIPEAPASEKALRHWERNRALMLGALDEDFALGERIQETLGSGANRHLSFGHNERLLARFHQELGRRLG